MRTRKLGVGIGVAILALGLAGGPAFAGKGGGPVNAVTHTSGHADTTSVSGPCTDTSPNGPVWAYDNLSLRLNVVPEAGPGNYSVTIYANGSFTAIANPNTGECYTGHGGVDGWLQLDVSSTTPPNPKSLPSQVPGDVSQGAIMNMLFDGNATVVGGGSYSYTYKLVDGSKYTQVG